MLRVDVGCLQPKDLHVSPRLRSSFDVPRNEDIWATMLESTWDRSTVTVVATTTGSISWLPASRPRRRSCSISDSSSVILPCSSATSFFPADSSSAILPRSTATSEMTMPSSDDDFSLFALPLSAILGSQEQLNAPKTSPTLRASVWRRSTEGGS